MARSSSFDSIESTRPAFTRREIETLNKRYFDEVIEAYTAIRQLPVLTAQNFDADAEPSKKLNADAVHYCVDVEHAIDKALEGSPELQVAFVQIIDGASVNDGLRKRVESTVGRLFKSRSLDPGAYFRRVRRGRCEMQAKQLKRTAHGD